MAFYEFPGSNFHDLNLDWLLQEVKNCIAEWAATKAELTSQIETLNTGNETFKSTMEAEWEEMKTYIQNYFASLDLDQEITDAINAMIADGRMHDLIYNDVVTSAGNTTTTWLAEHITQETGYVIDNTLTVANAAADAAATGEQVKETNTAAAEIAKRVINAESNANVFPWVPYYHRDATQVYTTQIDLSYGRIRFDGTPSGGFMVSILGKTWHTYNQYVPNADMLSEGPFSLTVGHVYKLQMTINSGTTGDTRSPAIIMFDTAGAEIRRVTPGNPVKYFIADSASFGQLGAFVFRNGALTALDVNVSLDDVTEEIDRLPHNPYQDIAWNSTLQLKSVCHAHCLNQAQFETLKSHYDHLAISNYHPSAPTYPLAGRFSDVGDTLASPNAEHAYFPGLSSHFHANSLGSFICTTTNNPLPLTFAEFAKLEAQQKQYVGGGGITVNHPRWSGMTLEQLTNRRFAQDVIALEVYNAGCERSNATGISTELWDGLLAMGYQMFAVAVPDHEAQYHPDETTYGFGYNYMLVCNRSEAEILMAYRNGAFYCSTRDDGTRITGINFNGTTLQLETNVACTFKVITNQGETDFPEGLNFEYTVQEADKYIRVEAYHGDNRIWTNPIMI